MTMLSALWLPILLSSIIVFVASSIIHMATPWHKSDYRKVPDEDKVMEALRPFSLSPGDYMMPRPSSMQDLKSPAFTEKRSKGPVMVFTVMPEGPVSMNAPPAKPSCIGAFVYTGFPAGERRGVHRLRGRAVANVYLVSPLVGHHDPLDNRRPHLRAADRRRLRLAMAALASQPKVGAERRYKSGRCILSREPLHKSRQCIGIDI